MFDEKRVTQLARALRIRALEMAYSAGNDGSHLGGGLSAIEIFAVLYGAVLKYDVCDPCNLNRDRLIVSKGHCVLAYYSALEYAGFLSPDDIGSFEKNGSPFHGHATRDLEKGIEFSGGSLSMGLSFGVGVALACKMRGLSARVFTIVGDGECNEGLAWESLMAAANFKLSNLTVIVDCNGLQYDGRTVDIMNSDSLSEKYSSFGFRVSEVDGHDCVALYEVLQKSVVEDKPNAIIAHTIKGKGVSFMESRKEWHHSRLSQQQFELAMQEQGKTHDGN